MLQNCLKKYQSLIVNHSSGPMLLPLILGVGLLVQTVLFPLPAFSQSKEAFPTGDQEYFRALLELEKDEAYKKFLRDSVSYAGKNKVEYKDFKGVRPKVERAEPTKKDASHYSTQTFEALRDLDWFRKNNYQNFIRNVGQNIYPVIIASDYEPGQEGIGGTYYLYRKDRPVEMVAPTSVMYEMEKMLAHLPMGVFFLISPYFDNVAHRPEGWEEPLLEYQQHVETIQERLQKSDIREATSIRANKMLDMVHQYLQDCLAHGAGDAQSYSAFAHKIIPYVAEAMKAAVRSQIEAGLSAMNKWKKELGPQEWDRLHVLIPVVWPVAQGNPRRQLFEHLMTPERAKTNIFEVHARSHDEARTTLGRIKGDSVMASLTFDKNTDFGKMSYLRLSSPTDLVQGVTGEELKKYPKSKTE